MSSAAVILLSQLESTWVGLPHYRQTQIQLPVSKKYWNRFLFWCLTYVNPALSQYKKSLFPTLWIHVKNHTPSHKHWYVFPGVWHTYMIEWTHRPWTTWQSYLPVAKHSYAKGTWFWTKMSFLGWKGRMDVVHMQIRDFKIVNFGTGLPRKNTSPEGGYPCVYLYFYLSIVLWFYRSMHPSIHPSIPPSIHPSLPPSIHPSIHLSWRAKEDSWHKV